jgi:hypothetical protein
MLWRQWIDLHRLRAGQAAQRAVHQRIVRFVMTVLERKVKTLKKFPFGMAEMAKSIKIANCTARVQVHVNSRFFGILGIWKLKKKMTPVRNVADEGIGCA